MRTTLSLCCLMALLVFVPPAEAQLRKDLGSPAPTAVYDEDGGHQNRLQQWFSTLFSDEHFQMTNTYEMSFSSFGGQSAGLGMYTNTMQWRFNDAWAARVDVSVAQNLLGSSGLGGGQSPKVFLRNAEVSYRPNDHMQFRFQMRQSPYGRYAGPFGRYAGPFGRSGLRRGFPVERMALPRAPFRTGDDPR